MVTHVALICISLKTSDVQHLFILLFAFNISFPVKSSTTFQQIFNVFINKLIVETFRRIKLLYQIYLDMASEREGKEWRLIPKFLGECWLREFN